jgi:hypothetical protein
LIAGARRTDSRLAERVGYKAEIVICAERQKGGKRRERKGGRGEGGAIRESQNWEE